MAYNTPLPKPVEPYSTDEDGPVVFHQNRTYKVSSTVGYLLEQIALGNGSEHDRDSLVLWLQEDGVTLLD
jgi:hypothetical protein